MKQSAAQRATVTASSLTEGVNALAQVSSEEHVAKMLRSGNASRWRKRVVKAVEHLETGCELLESGSGSKGIGEARAAASELTKLLRARRWDPQRVLSHAAECLHLVLSALASRAS